MQQPQVRPKWGAKQIGSLVLVFTVLLPAAGCTVSQNDQYKITTTLLNTRVNIFNRPSWQLIELAQICQALGHETEMGWSKCSLSLLREHMDVPTIAKADWGYMSDDGEWQDYAGAINEAYRGGIRIDSRGDIRTRRCVVVDRAAFQDANWTTRDEGDANCLVGQYAKF